MKIPSKATVLTGASAWRFQEKQLLQQVPRHVDSEKCKSSSKYYGMRTENCTSCSKCYGCYHHRIFLQAKALANALALNVSLFEISLECFAESSWYGAHYSLTGLIGGVYLERPRKSS